MSLTSLSNYKTLSEKRLLEAFNEAMTAADANFTYTLGQVASPVPSLTGVAQNSVIAVGQSNSNNILEYRDPSELINLQTTFSSYLDQQSKINLTDDLEFSVNALNSPFSTFSVTSRGSSGAGSINNYMRFTQLSNSGELNETHVVSAFSLTSNSINLTTNTGFVQLNKLQVGDYKFPNAAGSSGQVLKLGAANTLEFAAINNEIISQVDSYTLNQNKPLLLSGKGGSDVSLGLYDLESGIGTSTQSLSGNQEVFFKFRNSRLLAMTKPVSPGVGAPTSSYLKVEGPITLPNATDITSQNSHEGSVWYDGLNNSLVVITAQGKLNIKAQSTAVAAAVNTEEAKVFNLNPSASIALGQGTNVAPAVKIGNVGLTSSLQDLKIVFGSTPVVKITATSIEPNTQTNGAAKVLFDSTLGFNNPANPAYTFSGASQLGMYRSASNAIGMSVQGQCVSEFSATGLDLKTRRLFNIAAPIGALDGANKQYVDSLIPSGSTANSIPLYSVSAGKYIESEVKYATGILEVGSGSNAGAVSLKTTSSGSVTLKAPAGSQNLTFFLPSSTLTDGILRVNAQGYTYWDSKTSVTSGLLKIDGSVQMTGGIRMATATTKTNPLIGIGTVGMYAAEGANPKIGFASNNTQILELDVTNKTLTGIGTTLNAPYVRLDATTNAYSDPATQGSPTYSFAGSTSTGLGQIFTNGVSLLVSGAPKLSVSSTGILAHNSKIQNLATPTQNSDAATKAYVDGAVKTPIEIAFRVDSLPVGWTSGNALTLSIYDKSLIYQNSAVILPYESAADPEEVVIPSNFNTNSKCQCYVENIRLVKMAKQSGVRQVSYLNNTSLLINYAVSVGQVITVYLEP